MPIKGGKLTPQERVFIEKYAATGDGPYSAEKAGYNSPSARASQNLAKPAVQAEVRRAQMARLHNTLVPLSLDHFENTLRDPKAPIRDKTMIGKIVLDHAKASTDGETGKEPHEMSGDELQAALDRLRREASERAQPVKVIEHEPESDLFG